jgi:hypothetical protein
MDHQVVLMNWLGIIATVLGSHTAKLDAVAASGEDNDEKWRVHRRRWIRQCRTAAQEDLLAYGFATLVEPKPKPWLTGMWNAKRISPANGNKHTTLIYIHAYFGFSWVQTIYIYTDGHQTQNNRLIRCLLS